MAESASKIKHYVNRSIGDTSAQGINGGDSHGKSKSKRNYKLLIDPAIKKGHQKIYRFDGVLSGKPSIIPRDPRPPRTKLWTATIAELPIPRFKVDKYYVGSLPENTIRFGCLNDNINRQFLRELCSKFGKIEECKVYYDIKSKKHLGTGKITFSTASAARQAVSELDGSSVMGNIIRVSIERKKNRNRTSERHSSTGHSSKDPREFRDPRRSISTGSNAGLPTPSPSQYSPSVESTPPTPLVSAMNRPHPVALLKHGQYQRRGNSLDNDITPLESPASICSASFNSTTFEPVSPPAVVRMRSSSSDNLSFPPPPPPERSSNLPPPPPPSKQGIYEDISPTTNFDDETKSPRNEKNKNGGKDLNINDGRGAFVQAHLLGLKIACAGENSKGGGRQEMTSCIADGSRNHEIKQRQHSSRCRSPNIESSRRTYNKEYETSGRPEKYDKKSDSSSNYKTSFRTEPGVCYDVPKPRNNLNERKSKSDLEIKLNVAKKSSNDAVYEAISDSDDDGSLQKVQSNTAKNLQVEDISPVNSPVGKSSFNGLALVKAKDSVVPEKSATIKQNDKLDTTISKVEVENDGKEDDDGDDDDDDDDDDAMSLSSISSNEESSLVLNTPAVPVTTPSSASSFQSFPNQPSPFVHTRPNLTLHPQHTANIVARPPVNIPAPPHVAPPSQINIQPVNVHQQPRQPPINVQQPPVITRLPPPPPVNIRIPPPGIGFNQNIPPPPYRPPTVQPPQIRTTQAPPSYPPTSAGGGFLGSFSRPYQGFFSGNYQNYRDFNMNPGRHIAAVVKEIPYEEKVKDFCIMKTRKDLKAVLHRDLIKRLVEHSGFSALEAWWDNQTKKKELSLATSRPTTLPHTSASPMNISHNESPSSSTTSSLLMSLFGRAQASSSSSSSSLNFQSPTRIHGPISKIPSFRINRIPQVRPLGREAINRKLKREGKSSGLEVANKLRKLSPEEDEAERTVKEEESDSESDSETERRLLASRRSTVTSGSSLYQTIYESSEIEDSDEDQKSDEEDEEEKFQELIHQQQKLKKEQMRLEEEKRFEEKGDIDEEEDEEMSIEGEEEERSSDEDEGVEMDEDEEEVDEEEDDEDDDEEHEESEDSEWESSGAEEAVQEVIRETEKRLEHFKEKSVKKEDKKKKKIEHEKLVKQYLNRVNDRDVEEKERESMEGEISVLDRAKNDVMLRNQEERAPEELEIKENLKEIVSETSKILTVEKEHILKKANETLNKVVEETIEETEILSKDTELDGSEIKEELISEEIIKIEPEGEVLNEHSYAFTSPYEEQELEELKEEDVIKVKEKSPSPVIDVVDINDDKDFIRKRLEPKPVFPMRSIDHENSIVWNVLREGIDNEDLKYLQTAFESLHVFGSNVVKDHHWSHHPETLVQSKQRRTRGEPILRVHNTGCARSEGYYKIPLSEKSQYLSSVMRQLETKDESNDKESDGLKHKQQSRENRAMQRRLISSFVNDDFGDLVKFNKLKSRKKKLKFAKSGIHNWGLFTCEPIAAEEMVIEYVGEIVRSVIADAREKHYEKTGIGSSYLFRLDAETVIDATKIGNNARFINHSCAPNCYAKIINVENEKKIVIYSKYDIKMNDEITYDYKFPIEEVKIQCLCGTPQCRGTLN